ncbi:MAG: phosphoribosylanthranilate isomerase [Nitrososphaerales archaeon]
MHAAECGADALGFVCGYADSPRNLTMRKLKQLVAAVPPYVSSVVVTPLSNPEIVEIVRAAHPSFLQVSGEGSKVIENLHRETGFDRIIQTVHMDNEARQIIARCKKLAESSKALLLDSKDNNSPKVGGTGVVHDWNVSKKVSAALHFPIILGGGLNPANVALAVNIVRPYAVDVSSGVEARPGIKQDQKVKEFIQNAKKPFH